MRADGMGELNEYLVLEFLREHIEATRTDLASALSLSAASVSRIVSRLLERGMVEETTAATSTGRGRPSTVLRLVLDHTAVAGIDLGGTKCHGVLSGLDGNTIDEYRVLVQTAGSATDALTQTWRELQTRAHARGLTIGALAVGVPAVVDPDSGIATQGPNVGWERFDIMGHLRDFGVPFVVDNDVNLAALAEGEFGQAQGLADYALVSIGTGLGGAVVCGGRLVRGRHNGAGELGTMIPDLGTIRHRPVGPVIGLEGILSGAAIAADARRLALAEPAAAAEFGADGLPREVLAAAREGRPHAQALVGRVLDALALAIVNLVATTDPEVVIIDGSVGRSLEPFLDEVRDIVRLHVQVMPEIVVSVLGTNTAVRGAVSQAITTLRQLDAPEILTAIPSEKER